MNKAEDVSAIRLVSPLSAVQPVTKSVARRVRATLDGAVLGVVTNVFRGEDLPASVASEIASLYGCADVVRYEKPSLSHPADKAALERIAETADGVVVGVCG